MNQPKNTKDQGVVNFVFFKEGNNYVGVCLTFDIVIEAPNFNEVKEEIVKAAKLHLDTVIKNDLSESLLNRPAPQEYWDRRGGLLVVGGSGQSVPSPITTVAAVSSGYAEGAMDLLA